MVLSEQVLLWLILVAVVFLFLFPYMKRQSNHMRRQPRGRMPPTSDGLSMSASKALVDAEIAAHNAHVYQMEDIPPEHDRLTLYRYYREFRDEGIAGAYLYPGVRSRDDCTGRHAPAPYYHYKGSIWSWDGDNRQLDNAGLQVEAKARFDRMLAQLEQNGWRSVSHEDQVTLLHLYRQR